MPEGDTIWRTAAALRGQLAGQELLGASPPVLGRLAGQRLEDVEAFGKHLYFHFSGPLALHSHLGMTGSWHLQPPSGALPRGRVTAQLRFQRWVAVLFRGTVPELTRRELSGRQLGPDILAPGYDPEESIRRGERVGPATLGEWLLDQRVVAGIGNVYKCEALFQLQLDPWASPAATESRVLRQLLETARTMMLANLSGRSRRRFSVSGGRRPAAVHGRAGRPCPRCASPVRCRPQGRHARLTYYCARCQGVSSRV